MHPALLHIMNSSQRRAGPRLRRCKQSTYSADEQPLPQGDAMAHRRRVALLARHVTAALSSDDLPAHEPVPGLSGPIVAVGGGGMDEGGEIVSAIKALGGVNEPSVLILPQASAREDAGEAGVAMWAAAGAGRVVNHARNPIDRDVALAELARADILWFPGGQQTRLADALVEAELMDAIRQRNASGLVIGGTSAGAAIMSKAMLSGTPESGAYLAGARAGTDIPEPRVGWLRGLTHQGLALWSAAILDQHFTQRSRQSRLLTAVLDDPARLGVGIDERTAVVVHGQTFRVVGEGTVTIYDARAAVAAGAFEDGDGQSVRDAKVSLLRSGQEYNWQQPPLVPHPQNPSADLRSYRLGAIGAFAECVGAGVKTLGLSSAMPPSDLSALLEDAKEIIARNDAQYYYEDDFLVTDLFPPEVTDGMHLLLIFGDDSTLTEYTALKAAKAALVERGEYEGEAREGIARGMATLLSYTEEKTQALLDGGGAHVE
jgi:cyanophycinase